MVRHLPTVVQSRPQPPVWSSGQWRSSSGPGSVVGPSGRDVSGAKQREPLRFPTNSGSGAAELNCQSRASEDEQINGNKDPAKTQIRTMLDQ